MAIVIFSSNSVIPHWLMQLGHGVQIWLIGWRLLCLPSIEVEIYCFTSHRSFVRPISFVSVLSLCLSCRRSTLRSVLCLCVVLVYHAGGQTRDVDPMSGYCLRRWANISLVLGYPVVFDATLDVGQSHRQRDNINPALVQDIVSEYGYMLRKPIIDPAMCRCKYISLMPGHCVPRWQSIKRHWGVVYYVHVLTVLCLLGTVHWYRSTQYPASTKHLCGICAVLGQCRICWADVVQLL